jgi:hypothetical protein
MMQTFLGIAIERVLLVVHWTMVINHWSLVIGQKEVSSEE